MERQRSFSVKSTSFLALFLTISSSLLFLIFFSLWAFNSSSTPLLLPFNISPILSPPFNTTNSPILRNFSSDKAPILIQTQVAKPENTSGSPRSSAAEVVLEGNRGFDSKLLGTVTEIQNPSDVIEALHGLKEEEGAVQDVPWTDRGIGSKVVLDTAPQVEKHSGEIEDLNGQKKGVENEGIKLRDCDLGKGSWVYDESYPLYTNWSCPFIDEGFNCAGNGRPDNGYTKWRWQPQDCQIPRFDATEMLELIRGKRLVFVGDSINRNQWESMMCMLMGAVRDPKKVYETRGRRITKEKGNYCFRFVDYKCTVEYYVTHFLVHESKGRIGQKRVPTLRIDSIDRGSSRWRGADVLVFNTAHWWSHYKTKAGINYYQEGSLVHPKLDVSTAFRKALTTWASWVDKHTDSRKTQVFFRSSSPSHFRGGEWNSGGHCREAKLPLNTTSATGYSEKNSIAEEVIKSMRTPVTFLNITGLSGYRIDAHPSAYGARSRNGRGIEDCSHWCLPGVPDTWNELLYLHLQRKKGNFHRGTA